MVFLRGDPLLWLRNRVVLGELRNGGAFVLNGEKAVARTVRADAWRLYCSGCCDRARQRLDGRGFCDRLAHGTQPLDADPDAARGKGGNAEAVREVGDCVFSKYSIKISDVSISYPQVMTNGAADSYDLSYYKF